MRERSDRPRREDSIVGEPDLRQMPGLRPQRTAVTADSGGAHRTRRQMHQATVDRARRMQAALGGTPRSRVGLLAPALALAAVAIQISYPLARGALQLRLAVVIVAVFALACLAHAATTRSPRTALAALAVSGGLGFAAELVGVHTAHPFGAYTYTSALGARVLGVPLIVALAWTMLAWPAAVVARHVVRGRLARVLVGAWALAAADLFLDPQLVALHGWTWRRTDPHLPGVSTVPLTNFAGWLLVALVLSAVLQQVVGDGPDLCAVALYLWLWIGWTIAQVFYLDLRASAAWGFVGMGAVAIPLLRRVLLDSRAASPGAAWPGGTRPQRAQPGSAPRVGETGTGVRAS